MFNSRTLKEPSIESKWYISIIDCLSIKGRAGDCIDGWFKVACVSPFDIPVARTWAPMASVMITEDSDDTAFYHRLHNMGVDIFVQAMRLY